MKRRKRSTTRRRRRTTSRRRNTSYTARPRRRRRRVAAPRRRRRRNSTRIIVRRNARRRRRNPSLFGGRVSNAQMVQAVFGGLVGVTAAKLIPAALPPNLTATPIMRILSSVGSAFASGWVAGRFSQPFGDAVLFGGLMQAGSIALNAFVPAIGSQIGLQGLRGGLGDLVPGAYPIPQNPLNPAQANYPSYGRPAVPAGNGTFGPGAPVTMNGVSRAFGRAF